jgi:hypothetical protein
MQSESSSVGSILKGPCPTWMDPIGECHLTCSQCPNHYFGYSECYRQHEAFLFADIESAQKIGLGPGWTVQFGGGQIFRTSCLVKYFGYSCLMRKFTKLGTLDSASPQTDASGDTWTIHFGPLPISLKNTPFVCSTSYIASPTHRIPPHRQSSLHHR